MLPPDFSNQPTNIPASYSATKCGGSNTNFLLGQRIKFLPMSKLSWLRKYIIFGDMWMDYVIIGNVVFVKINVLEYKGEYNLRLLNIPLIK